MKELEEINQNIFENIKHIAEEGREYWSARELMTALDYRKWQKFENVIMDSQKACLNSNNIVDDHFIQVGKMVKISSNTNRQVIDYKLSRYACYLIVQTLIQEKRL